MDAAEKFIRMRKLIDRFVIKYGRLPTETDPDYLEMLRMSKYIIKDVPMHPPGKCANCGASKNDGRKYIDFGLLVEWYGTVYLCGECLKDISTDMGLFRDMEEAVVKAEMGKLLIDELKKEGERLHDSVAAQFKELEDYYAGLHSVGDDSSSDTTPIVESYESPTGPPTADENKSNVDGPKPRITKSTSSSGRKNISSLADLLNNTGD